VTALAAIVATVVSLAALAYLAATDPKRRRVFRVAPFAGRRLVGPALAAVFLPGVLLLAFANGAGFIVWLGALSVAGWGVAALSPAQATHLRAWTKTVTAALGDGFAVSTERAFAGAAALARSIRAAGGMPRRIAALEARISALEAELAAIRESRGRSRPLPAFENDSASVAAPLETAERGVHRVPRESVR